MVGFPMEVARSHDEVDFGGPADIGDGVAGHGHDVGDPARFENADVLAAEEFGGGSGGGAQGPGGVDSISRPATPSGPYLPQRGSDAAATIASGRQTYRADSPDGITRR
jgi:hypothetical protein